MVEYNRVQLKQAAKQAMRFQRPHPMLITLLCNIMINIGAQIVSQILGAASGANTLASLYTQAMLRYEEPMDAIQYVLLSVSPQRLALALFVGGFIASIITSLWAGLMRTGYAGFCLNMARGRQPQTGALFSVFPQWAGVLLTLFLTGLFRGLWALLLGVGLFLAIFIAALLFAQLEALFVLVLLCAYIAFFLGLIWVTLRYAMVDFLIADQGITGLDAIRESKRLMRGNTGKLFTLQLSFIGWYLLEGIILSVAVAVGTAFGIGLFSSDFSDPTVAIAGTALGLVVLIAAAVIAIGIFNLWLTPYVTGSEALFYDWARGASNAGSYGFGPDRGWGPPQYPNQPQHFDYNWTPGGPQSGTGIGSGTPPQQPPAPPKSPKDDPWD